jgi:hypothetical protein
LRALIGAGLGFAASMLVLGAALLIARTLYLNSVPAGTPADAAAAAFDILGPVHQNSAAHPARGGPGRGRRRVLHRPVRRGSPDPPRAVGWPGPATPRRTIRTGQPWTCAHRHALRIGAVALAALIFIFWAQPTAAVVIVIAVLLLVVLGLIEVIGSPPAQPEVEGHP